MRSWRPKSDSTMPVLCRQSEVAKLSRYTSRRSSLLFAWTSFDFESRLTSGHLSGKHEFSYLHSCPLRVSPSGAARKHRDNRKKWKTDISSGGISNCLSKGRAPKRLVKRESETPDATCSARPLSRLTLLSVRARCRLRARFPSASSHLAPPRPWT